ncbi:MAG TPA: SulP family inorganic anion transporter [Paludibaculum sp.]|jgi:SulP family sulfate permease
MKLPRFRYSWKALFGDMSGGVIAALIALPYGLAMAALMGLPPVLGLFTSLLTSPVTALLGRNPLLIGGTANATVPFIQEAVHLQGIGGAAKVTLVASVFMMVFSVLRLGRFISKVPHAVVTGFSCGIGGMMILSQLKSLAAMKMSNPAHWWQPIALAAFVMIACIISTRLAPRAPAPLIAVTVGAGLAILLGLKQAEVGYLSLDLPPFVGFSWSPQDVYVVLPAGFGLAFVAAVNILITSRVVEHFRGRHRAMKMADADVELGAYGIANVIAGFFAAPMSVGIPARSLASIRCGGTTRMSNLFHAAVLAAVLWLGSGALAHIPLAALAGVTAWMGFCLLDWSAWRRIPKMRKVDAAAFLSTAILVLGFNAVAAVAVGCAVYGVEWMWNRIRSTNTGSPVSAQSSA